MSKEAIMRSCGRMLCLVMLGWVLTVPVLAQDDQAAELAKKLSNPVASLISVPVQYNYDEYGGVNDGGSATRLLMEPVVPFSFNEDWNLITRTIIPIVDQEDFPVEALNESGFGDIAASQFFSPKSPTAGGWIWGVGPVELLPTASDRVLGTGRLSLGPTAVLLKQMGPWTIGYLGSHIWSVDNDADREGVNITSVQPFASYTTKIHSTIGVYTESTYDWKNEQWTVPLIVQAGQLFKIGPQIMQLAVAGKHWAESPDAGPEGWGLRVQLTFLFPK